jgi:hypothetical protein
MSPEARAIRFVGKHPGCTARAYAQAQRRPSAQLAVGSFLQQLVKRGLLTAQWHDGWKYFGAVGRVEPAPHQRMDEKETRR